MSRRETSHERSDSNRSRAIAASTRVAAERSFMTRRRLQKIQMSSELRYQPPSAQVADVPALEVVGPLNPWFSMWSRPRATIQQIVDSDPSRFIVPMCMLIGVTQVLDRASSQSMGDRASLGTILAIAFVVGPFMSLIASYVYAWLVSWSGRLIGGRAPLPNIRAAIVWGNVPALWTALSWIPALIVLRIEMFTTETPLVESSSVHMLVLIGVAFAQVFGAIWSLVVLCKALGQVQRFSGLKAFGNILLAALVLIAPILLVVLAIVASR